MAKWNSKANDVFLRAAEVKSLAERRLYLDQQCGDDVGLLAQVESLLAASEQVGSFLNQPAFQNLPGTRGTVDELPITEGPSTMIGPYKLLQQIGEGGMGVVYMAEQEQPLRRKVALKIIKPGMDSAQVIARFEVERQALALMDHQNIARVLDAGTTASGRPYFVMELVHGVPITKYCDANKLAPRQRLELFLPVCQAIQHAHQKGIIHRDIKPSNVMVTLHDGQPVPKVIDFGVAKATEQRLTERTLFTQYGTIVGTLEYMAPEQAEMSGLGVDTRSDIYSLGVLLYELLTGTTPLERSQLREAAYEEMMRLIREEEPPRPSQRISTSGDRLATISADRNTEPAQLSRLVCGELDWIVMRCLEKDRTRRYETANGLARDVERYLKDEPVEACPPTAGYKLRKFARKHKTGLATAAGFAALLVLGTTVSAWQAVRATQAEKAAVAERDEKEQARQAETEQRAAALRSEQVAQQERDQAQQQRNVAQQQRDEAQKQRDEVRALNEKLQAKEARLQRTLYTAHMNLAKSAWDAGNIRRVDELLAQHRPKPGEADLRGFEWHYLYRLCHSDILTLKSGSGSVAYSPDGKRLASGSKVWDAQTGQELLTLQGHGRIVFMMVFSPDGNRLASATANWDSTKKAYDNVQVNVCDAQTGQELFTIKGHTGWVNRVAFSPDGKRLAIADGKVKVWDAQTGQELLSLKGGGSSVAFSPDGKRLAIADGKVKVWDAQTGQELLSLKGGGSSVAFSPDGKRLASAPNDNTVKVWDTQTGQELLTLKGHTGGVTSVAFSPDGKRLASTSGDRTVKVWDVQTGQELLSLKERDQSVVFSPDGKRLASAAKEVKVWDAQTGQELLTFKGHSGWVSSVVFSPDGTRLASGSYDDGTVKIWDATVSQEARTFSGDTSGFRSVSFSPDGKRLAFGTAGTWDDTKEAAVDARVKILDAQTGQEVMSFKGHSTTVNSVAYSPDGTRLASASTDQTVKVWDAQTGRELLTFKGHTAPVICVAFSPDSTRLVSCSNLPSNISFGPGAKDPGEPGEVVVWDANSGQELLTLKGHRRFVNSVAFSPDGKRLATLSRDNTVKVWDAQTGREIHTLKVLAAVNGCVAFSPDGRRLVSSSHTPPLVAAPSPHVLEAKVWDVQTGGELFSLKGLSGAVTSVAFSPDGKRLITGSGGFGAPSLGEVKVWDALTGQELITLDGRSLNSDVALSPDGHRLVGRGRDRTVKIWDATPLPEKP
jgi:WD40 repeat protein/serine/threonine protein kinase